MIESCPLLACFLDLAHWDGGAGLSSPRKGGAEVLAAGQRVESVCAVLSPAFK